MRAFAAYLFDLDGTLIDSIDLIFRAYRHTAERHLSFSPPDSVWREGLGTPLRQQLSAVCEDPELIECVLGHGSRLPWSRARLASAALGLTAAYALWLVLLDRL